MTSLGLFFVAAFPVMAFRDYERHVDEVATSWMLSMKSSHLVPPSLPEGGGGALAQLACPEWARVWKYIFLRRNQYVIHLRVGAYGKNYDKHCPVVVTTGS